MGWKTIQIREGLLRRIEEKAKQRGMNKSRAINKALEFLLLMGFFDYANPYEWIEAKAYEMCGEEKEVEYKEEEKKREKQQGGRIGTDVPIWGEKAQPQVKEKQFQPTGENKDKDDDWVITF